MPNNVASLDSKRKQHQKWQTFLWKLVLYKYTLFQNKNSFLVVSFWRTDNLVPKKTSQISKAIPKTELLRWVPANAGPVADVPFSSMMLPCKLSPQKTVISRGEITPLIEVKKHNHIINPIKKEDRTPFITIRRPICTLDVQIPRDIWWLDLFRIWFWGINFPQLHSPYQIFGCLGLIEMTQVAYLFWMKWWGDSHNGRELE